MTPIGLYLTRLIALPDSEVDPDSAHSSAAHTSMAFVDAEPHLFQRCARISVHVPQSNGEFEIHEPRDLLDDARLDEVLDVLQDCRTIRVDLVPHEARGRLVNETLVAHRAGQLGLNGRMA